MTEAEYIQAERLMAEYRRWRSWKSMLRHPISFRVTAGPPSGGIDIQVAPMSTKEGAEYFEIDSGLAKSVREHCEKYLEALKGQLEGLGIVVGEPK